MPNGRKQGNVPPACPNSEDAPADHALPGEGAGSGCPRGPTVLQAVELEQPEVVLPDYRLPDGDGVALG